MLIARSVQNANMPYDEQPEAMCKAKHAMASSEYRSGLETVRAHVNAMCMPCAHMMSRCALRF
jgi:hypothetical protein